MKKSPKLNVKPKLPAVNGKAKLVPQNLKAKPVTSNGKAKLNVANGKSNGKGKKTVPAATSNGKKTDKKLATLSLDDLMNSASEDDEEEDSEIEEGSGFNSEIESGEEESADEAEGVEGEEAEDEDADNEEGEEESEDDSEADSDEEVGGTKMFKQTLGKLKDTDPDFYKFISENDKALFEADDSSESEDERGGKVHKLPNPDELEVGSDESDFEDEKSAEKRQGNVITQAMVDQWQQELKNPKSVKVIATVVSAFRSAVHSVTEENTVASKFKVQGSSAFNAVVRLCIIDLIPAFRKFLKAPEEEKLNVERCKSWVKLRLHVKSYLADVIRLMGSLSESSLLSVMLKHVHQLIPFYAAFVKISRVLCKRLVAIWCSGEDTIRVLAFLSLLRLARTIPNQLLEPMMKGMYLSYTRNCKFTSPSTWPVINFMRRSLVELMCLQEHLTYKHAFLYIRQLAIHLRNAMASKKKESVMIVYNWQYVHCLHFWAALLGALPDSQLMKPLIYPLIQIATGTINLVAVGKYYPLRFHIVSFLNQLSVDTGVFVPVLPFLLEIMQNYKFEKKPSKASMKPLDLSCILRVSQSQLAESGFRDAVVDLLYDRILETLQGQSHSCAFPELALPVILQIKSFIKKCPSTNYQKKMKQLMEKIQETVRFIDKSRAAVNFDLSDTRAVLAVENQLKQAGTPLTTYHSSWKKMKDREMAVKIAKRSESEKLDNVPMLKKPAQKSAEDSDNEEMNELFPSDLSDEGEDDEDRFLLKEERGTKRKMAEDKEEKKAKTKKTVEVKEQENTKSKKQKKAEKTKPAVARDEEEAASDEDIADQVYDFDLSDDEDDEELQSRRG